MPDCVTLGTIAGGAAVELFQVELDKVLRNIEDVNTDPKAKRRIVLEFIIQPDDARQVGAVGIRCSSKTASLKPVGAVLYFGRQAGAPIAIEVDTQQQKLFDQAPPELREVGDPREPIAR